MDEIEKLALLTETMMGVILEDDLPKLSQIFPNQDISNLAKESVAFGLAATTFAMLNYFPTKEIAFRFTDQLYGEGANLLIAKGVFTDKGEYDVLMKPRLAQYVGGGLEKNENPYEWFPKWFCFYLGSNAIDKILEVSPYFTAYFEGSHRTLRTLFAEYSQTSK